MNNDKDAEMQVGKNSFAATLSTCILLGGCVATLPEKNDAGGASQTSQKAAAQNSSSVERVSQAKIELPEGTVDGVKFVKEFRPELYLPNHEASALFQRMAVRIAELSAKQYPNAVEHQLVIKKVKETPYAIDIQQRPLPKYIYYPVSFLVFPKNVNMENGNFYLFPNYTIKTPRNSFGHNDRDACQSVDGCFLSQFVFGMPDNGHEFSSYPYKSKNNLVNVEKVILQNTVYPGYYQVKSLVKGVQHESNRHILIQSSLEEVRDILNKGFPLPKTQGVRFYTGYSILKVDSANCRTVGSIHPSPSQIICDIKTTPYKYVVEDFMGKPQYEAYPREFSIHSSQLKMPLISTF